MQWTSSISIPVALARKVIDYLEELQDEGPQGEGWKSDGLLADISELEAAVSKPLPEWTSNPPTEAGWYWLRGDDLQLVRVYRPKWESRLWVQYHGTEYEETVSYLRGCQWQGPVVPE